jgi:hypothetical protein
MENLFGDLENFDDLPDGLVVPDGAYTAELVAVYLRKYPVRSEEHRGNIGKKVWFEYEIDGGPYEGLILKDMLIANSWNTVPQNVRVKQRLGHLGFTGADVATLDAEDLIGIRVDIKVRDNRIHYLKRREAISS